MTYRIVISYKIGSQTLISGLKVIQLLIKFIRKNIFLTQFITEHFSQYTYLFFNMATISNSGTTKQKYTFWTTFIKCYIKPTCRYFGANQCNCLQYFIVILFVFFVYCCLIMSKFVFLNIPQIIYSLIFLRAEKSLCWLFLVLNIPVLNIPCLTFPCLTFINPYFTSSFS